MFDSTKPFQEQHGDSEHPTVAGQGDDLDRGTGLGASGGGLGKSTGFWPEKPAHDDLAKAGTDQNFDASLEEPKHIKP
jgi:hypothetical protein